MVYTRRNTHEVACDDFNDLLRHIVYISKLFIHGAIPSLCLITIKFRDPAARRDAIPLLEQTNCQGTWEGQLIARFVTS
ncbi:hypothetical protein ACN38_g7967 [Penicillium nordicum]|uniref:Uncharacterized protein n=1 Tax=Penicillium nordicum TaxID=229535 RepID=A0A0M8NY20_9EURO|nr:hypothetical protein ACN38_g7967 [Penicillium nordicum]